MGLRLSSFAHLIALNAGASLVLHAVSQLRMVVAEDVARVIAAFEEGAEPEAVVALLAVEMGAEPGLLRDCVAMLRERGLLTELGDAAEYAALAGELAPLHGRDPAALLDRHRAARKEGAHPYWSVGAPRRLASVRAAKHRLSVLLFGDCDVQMEADALRQEAAGRGIDLRVAASFVSDLGLAAERAHHAVIVGALAARHAVILGEPRHHDDGDPAGVYVAAMRALLTNLRGITAAPILIDGLPEPTLQPLGIADRSVHGHRNRFRRTNLALAELAEEFSDVTLVDVAAALGAAGAEALLDDGLVSFSHFGSPGWMALRPEAEKAAVFGQFPDMAPLLDALGGQVDRRERVVARAHCDALVSVLGVDRIKCVIVDLDGVLWPGVLAENGAPFGWAPDVSGPNSFVGLYFGIHEALLALRQRGILLACVSKNDVGLVRELWRYQPHDPVHRLLTPEHFVTSRINWRDKAENIAEIIAELGFAEGDFLFVDDSARERERVGQALPGVELLGEDLFAVRRALLSDPRLMPARLSEEAGQRSALVRAQLDRARLRARVPDVGEFVASLGVEARAERLAAASADGRTLERVSELFARTTQFNATGRRFGVGELRALVDGAGVVVVLYMRDRLADHGLVGAAVVIAGEIANLVMSCRVIGLGGEASLLAALRAQHAGPLRGRIIETDRNMPVRNLYRDGGFALLADGGWVFDQAIAGAGVVLEAV